MRSAAYIIFSCLLLVTGPGFKKPSNKLVLSKKLTIVFHHQVGNHALVLDDSVTNIFGDPITIERFRYYVSNFSITGKDGRSTLLPVQYFLVDESDSSSKKIAFDIPDEQISGIQFLLGVDSIRNVSGIQTGALDPLNGMFWTWNSGYVMAKLEGSSETLATPGHRFTYHIGGFRNGMNVVKKISLPLPEPNGSIQELHITADINKWFKGNSELKIAETPVCHEPGKLAMRIADNYRNMFTLNSVR